MKKHSLYFVNSWIDALCMGGISIFVYLYFRYFYSGYSRYQISDSAIFASMALTWVVNFPHFASSSFYLYQNKERRKKYFTAAYIAPILLLGIAALCLFYQESVAPYFIKAFSIWSPYHYCAQTLGLIFIYAKRGNYSLAPLDRKFLSIAVFSAFLFQYIRVDSKLDTILVGSILLPKLGIPPFVAQIFYFSSIIFSALFAARFIHNHFTQKPTLPWIAFVPLLSHFTWFLTDFDIFSFQTVVPIFHGLQYLLLAWYVGMQEKNLVEEPIWKRSIIWSTANIFIAGILFYAIPNFIGIFIVNISVISTILFSAIQAHHFVVDAYIWKSKSEPNHPMLSTGISEEWSEQKAAA